jgi:hypothetical protein
MAMTSEMGQMIVTLLMDLGGMTPSTDLGGMTPSMGEMVMTSSMAVQVADRMEGGAGNDTYLVDNVGDLIDEKAPNDSKSFDTVESIITWTLGDNLEKLVLTGNSGD